MLLSVVLAVPGRTAAAADEISLKINGGTVRQAQSILYWEPDGGTRVVLDRSVRNSTPDMHWTLSAGYFDGDKIALWRGNAPGGTEYWGYSLKEGKWQLTDLATLGTTTGLNFDEVRFSSIRVLEFLRKKRVVFKFEITEEPQEGDALYRTVLRNECEWKPGSFDDSWGHSGFVALGPDSRRKPAALHTSDASTPPVEIADFTRLKDDELVQALKRGDLARFEPLIKADDPAALRLLFRAYTAAKKEGIYWSHALRLLSRSPQTWVAEEIWTDFWRLSSIFVPPNAEPSHGNASELLRTPKYVLAQTIVSIGDAAMTTRLWDMFPGMSPENQMVVALTAREDPRLGAVSAILKASKYAKTDEIAGALVNSASQLVVQALEDPTKREGAARVGEYLKKNGLARDFLLEKLK